MSFLRGLFFVHLSSGLLIRSSKVARSHSVRIRRDVVDWPRQLEEECLVEDTNDDILGASGLVFGTTVGAGILALPAALSSAGFLPGILCLVGSYVYMLASALLIAESTRTAVCELNRPGLSLLSTSRAELGEVAGNIGGIAYAFIHYCLLVAYSSQGGLAISQLFGLESETAIITFVFLFGSAVTFGADDVVEALNSFLVLVVALSFSAVCTLVWPQVSIERLLTLPNNFSAAFAAVPIGILALVYHNIVPLLVTRFQGDRSKVTLSLSIGSALPLAMFLLWTCIVLAAVPMSLITSGEDPVNALESALDGPTADTLVLAVSLFKLSAVATSFFGFYFGLRTFILDFLEQSSENVNEMTNLIVSATILVPPTLAALVLGDGVFLSALDVAGTWGIPVLFGIFPAAIVLSQRQRQRKDEDISELSRKINGSVSYNFLPGGDFTVYLVLVGALIVIGEGAFDALFHSDLLPS